MAFDDSKKEQLTKLLNFALPEAGKAISLLLNKEVQISIGDAADVKAAENAIAVDEENQSLFTAAFSQPENTALAILASKKLAWTISDLMTGGEGAWSDEVAAGEIKLTAFAESVNQTLSTLSEKLKAKNSEASLEIEEGALEQNEKIAETVAFNAKFAIADLIEEDFHLELNTELAEFLADNFADASEMQCKDSREGGVSSVEFARNNEHITSSKANPGQNLNLLMDIRMGLTVELGRSEMPLKEILKLTKGSVIELDRLSGEPVDLFVNNKLIARGEVVVIDDNFGLRITQLAGNLNLAQEMGLAAVADE